MAAKHSFLSKRYTIAPLTDSSEDEHADEPSRTFGYKDETGKFHKQYKVTMLGKRAFEGVGNVLLVDVGEERPLKKIRMENDGIVKARDLVPALLGAWFGKDANDEIIAKEMAENDESDGAGPSGQ